MTATPAPGPLSATPSIVSQCFPYSLGILGTSKANGDDFLGAEDGWIGRIFLESLKTAVFSRVQVRLTKCWILLFGRERRDEPSSPG